MPVLEGSEGPVRMRRGPTPGLRHRRRRMVRFRLSWGGQQEEGVERAGRGLVLPCNPEAPWEAFSAYGMIIPRCFWITGQHQPRRAFRYTG